MFAGMGEAVFLSLVAFSVVFAVLVLLTLMIFAMRSVGGNKDKKKISAPKAQSSKPSAQPKHTPTVTTSAAPQQAGVSLEIVAAITAAITAARGDSAFTIKSITPRAARQPYASVWGEMNKLDNVRSSLRESW